MGTAVNTLFAKGSSCCVQLMKRGRGLKGVRMEADGCECE